MGAISGIWIVTPQRHDTLVTKAVGIIQSFVLYFVLSKIEYRIYDFILSLVSHYFLMKNLSAVWSFFSSLLFGFFLSHASQLLTTSEHTGLRQSTESWQPRTESPHLLRPQGLKKFSKRGVFAKLQYVVPAADSLTPACQTCVSSYTDEADACLSRRLLHNMQYVDLSAFL